MPSIKFFVQNRTVDGLHEEGLNVSNIRFCVFRYEFLRMLRKVHCKCIKFQEQNLESHWSNLTLINHHIR